MNDLVSVVLCTYNGEKYIDEQVKTICGQSYSNLEIIIVDDASTDNCYNILMTHAAIDGRIRLFKNEENIGFNLNFNKACSLATGQFIAIADQDDVWEPNKIEVLLNEIKKENETVMVYSTSARFTIGKKPSTRSIRLVNFFEGNDIKKLFLFNSISGHNMLIRKKLVAASIPFPANIYYDWWLAIIACSIGKIRHVPEILVWHRMHESNITGAAKPILPFYKQTESNLILLLQKVGMNEADKQFGTELLAQYKKLDHHKFSLSLFFYLLRNSKTVFSHKKRTLPLISYLKNSFKYARQKTKA